MRDFITWLFIGHVHKWKVIQKNTLYKGNNTNNLPYGTDYILQCKHCGNIKQKRID